MKLLQHDENMPCLYSTNLLMHRHPLPADADAGAVHGLPAPPLWVQLGAGAGGGTPRAAEPLGGGGRGGVPGGRGGDDARPLRPRPQSAERVRRATVRGGERGGLALRHGQVGSSVGTRGLL